MASVDNLITIKKGETKSELKQRVGVSKDAKHFFDFNGIFASVNNEGEEISTTSSILSIDKNADGTFNININKCDIFKDEEGHSFLEALGLSADSSFQLTSVSPSIYMQSRGEELCFEITAKSGTKYVIKTSATKMSIEHEGKEFTYSTENQSTISVDLHSSVVEEFLDKNKTSCATPETIKDFPPYLIGLYASELKGNNQIECGNYTITTIDFSKDQKFQPYTFVTYTNPKTLAQTTYLYVQGMYKRCDKFFCQYEKDEKGELVPSVVLEVRPLRQTTNSTTKYYSIPVKLSGDTLSQETIQGIQMLGNIAVDSSKPTKTKNKEEEPVIYSITDSKGEKEDFKFYAKDLREYSTDYGFAIKPDRQTLTEDEHLPPPPDDENPGDDGPIIIDPPPEDPSDEDENPGDDGPIIIDPPPEEPGDEDDKPGDGDGGTGGDGDEHEEPGDEDESDNPGDNPEEPGDEDESENPDDGAARIIPDEEVPDDEVHPVDEVPPSEDEEHPVTDEDEEESLTEIEQPASTDEQPVEDGKKKKIIREATPAKEFEEKNFKKYFEAFGTSGMYIGFFLLAGAMLTGFGVLAIAGLAVFGAGFGANFYADKFKYTPYRGAKKAIEKYEKQEIEDEEFAKNFIAQETELDKLEERMIAHEDQLKDLLSQEDGVIHDFADAYNKYGIGFEDSELDRSVALSRYEGHSQKASMLSSIEQIRKTTNLEKRRDLINNFISTNFVAMPEDAVKKVESIFAQENNPELSKLTSTLKSAVSAEQAYKPTYEKQKENAGSASDIQMKKILSHKNMNKEKRKTFFNRYAPTLLKRFSKDKKLNEEKIAGLVGITPSQEHEGIYEILNNAASQMDKDIKQVIPNIAKQNRERVSSVHEVEQYALATQSATTKEFATKDEVTQNATDFLQKVAYVYRNDEGRNTAIKNFNETNHSCTSLNASQQVLQQAISDLLLNSTELDKSIRESYKGIIDAMSDSGVFDEKATVYIDDTLPKTGLPSLTNLAINSDPLIEIAKKEKSSHESISSEMNSLTAAKNKAKETSITTILNVIDKVNSDEIAICKGAKKQLEDLSITELNNNKFFIQLPKEIRDKISNGLDLLKVLNDSTITISDDIKSPLKQLCQKTMQKDKIYRSLNKSIQTEILNNPGMLDTYTDKTLTLIDDNFKQQLDIIEKSDFFKTLPEGTQDKIKKGLEKVHSKKIFYQSMADGKDYSSQVKLYDNLEQLLIFASKGELLQNIYDVSARAALQNKGIDKDTSIEDCQDSADNLVKIIKKYKNADLVIGLIKDEVAQKEIKNKYQEKLDAGEKPQDALKKSLQEVLGGRVIEENSETYDAIIESVTKNGKIDFNLLQKFAKKEIKKFNDRAQVQLQGMSEIVDSDFAKRLLGQNKKDIDAGMIYQSEYDMLIKHFGVDKENLDRVLTEKDKFNGLLAKEHLISKEVLKEIGFTDKQINEYNKQLKFVKRDYDNYVDLLVNRFGVNPEKLSEEIQKGEITPEVLAKKFGFDSEKLKEFKTSSKLIKRSDNAKEFTQALQKKKELESFTQLREQFTSSYEKALAGNITDLKTFVDNATEHEEYLDFASKIGLDVKKLSKTLKSLGGKSEAEIRNTIAKYDTTTNPRGLLNKAQSKLEIEEKRLAEIASLHSETDRKLARLRFENEDFEARKKEFTVKTAVLLGLKDKGFSKKEIKEAFTAFANGDKQYFDAHPEFSDYLKEYFENSELSAEDYAFDEEDVDLIRSLKINPNTLKSRQLEKKLKKVNNKLAKLSRAHAEQIARQESKAKKSSIAKNNAELDSAKPAVITENVSILRSIVSKLFKTEKEHNSDLAEARREAERVSEEEREHHDSSESEDEHTDGGDADEDEFTEG